MKYLTLNDLYRAYEYDELCRQNNPMIITQQSVIVKNNLDDIVFEIDKDDLIIEMAYWIHMPISD